MPLSGVSAVQIAQRLARLYEEQLAQALAAQAKELEVRAADAIAAERLQRIRAIDEARRRPLLPPVTHVHPALCACIASVPFGMSQVPSGCPKQGFEVRLLLQEIGTCVRRCRVVMIMYSCPDLGPWPCWACEPLSKGNAAPHGAAQHAVLRLAQSS